MLRSHRASPDGSRDGMGVRGRVWRREVNSGAWKPPGLPHTHKWIERSSRPQSGQIHRTGQVPEGRRRPTPTFLCPLGGRVVVDPSNSGPTEQPGTGGFNRPRTETVTITPQPDLVLWSNSCQLAYIPELTREQPRQGAEAGGSGCTWRRWVGVRGAEAVHHVSPIRLCFVKRHRMCVISHSQTRRVSRVGEQ